MAVRWGRYADSAGLGPWRARWERLRRDRSYRFARAFVLWCALLQFVVAFFALEGPRAQAATAAAVAASAPLFGLESAREGATVLFDGAFAFVVAPGCTGVSVAAMLLAAILAYPTSPSRRLVGVALCLPFTLSLNLVRLDTMAWLGVHAPSMFEAAHEMGWEAGVVLIGAGGFIAWARAVERWDAGAEAATRLRERLAGPALFAVFFIGGLSLALLSGADAALGRVTVALSTPAGRVLWGAAYPPPGLATLMKPVIVTTALVGYASLFLAAHGVPWRRRAWAATWGALVPVLLAQSVVTLMLGGVMLGVVERHSLTQALSALAALGVPLLAWILWSWRLRSERPATDRG